jgi:predicted DNA-binding protein (MmcQ/YjbR family)
MDLDELRKYCLSKKGTTESFPFGEETLVYKVASKIFAISSFELPVTVNLKCDPEYAVELREQYEEVQPGYHMNKKHWNTVSLSGKIPGRTIEKLIDHSYELVVSSLTKKERDNLN